MEDTFVTGSVISEFVYDLSWISAKRFLFDRLLLVDSVVLLVSDRILSLPVCEEKEWYGNVVFI